MATRTTRTRTAPPKPKPAPVEEVEGPEIPEFSTSTPKPDEEERRVLFRIDGEPFTVPKVIDQRTVYLGMDYMRQEGSLFAVMYLVELVLGGAQYARLKGLYADERITPDQFDQIGDLVRKLFFAGARGEDGTPDADTAGKDSDAS